MMYVCRRNEFRGGGGSFFLPRLVKVLLAAGLAEDKNTGDPSSGV